MDHWAGAFGTPAFGGNFYSHGSGYRWDHKGVEKESGYLSYEYHCGRHASVYLMAAHYSFSLAG